MAKKGTGAHGMPYSLQWPATCIEQLVKKLSRVTSAFLRKHCFCTLIWAFRGEGLFVLTLYLSNLWFDIYDMYIFELVWFFAIFTKKIFLQNLKIERFLFLQGQRVKKLNFRFLQKKSLLKNCKKSYEFKNIHVINIKPQLAEIIEHFIFYNDKE